jgi:hypothetical protein
MYALECNGYALAVSEDTKKLEEYRDHCIQRIMDDDEMSVINYNEKEYEIAYHTGFGYCTDKYIINKILVL